MPVPMPKKDEGKDDYVSRFMGDAVMLKEYPDKNQRYAICMSYWRKHLKDKKGD